MQKGTSAFPHLRRIFFFHFFVRCFLAFFFYRFFPYFSHGFKQFSPSLATMGFVETKCKKSVKQVQKRMETETPVFPHFCFFSCLYFFVRICFALFLLCFFHFFSLFDFSHRFFSHFFWRNSCFSFFLRLYYFDVPGRSVHTIRNVRSDPNCFSFMIIPCSCAMVFCYMASYDVKNGRS